MSEKYLPIPDHFNGKGSLGESNAGIDAGRPLSSFARVRRTQSISCTRFPSRLPHAGLSDTEPTLMLTESKVRTESTI